MHSMLALQLATRLHLSEFDGGSTSLLPSRLVGTFQPSVTTNLLHSRIEASNAV